jgi:choline dehydrogenase
MAPDIVISSGALVTPKLLMLSGVGPAKELREHGIDVVADLDGVGQNLIDHPEVPILATCNGPYGYFKHTDGWRMLMHGIQFKVFGTGVINSAGVEAGAFVNPLDPDAEPTIQAFCVPFVYLDRDLLQLIKPTYGVTVTTVVTKPKSRGFVRLASANQADMPVVSRHLLKHPDDMALMIAGQKFFLRAFQNPPLGNRIERILRPDPGDLSDEAGAISFFVNCERDSQPPLFRERYPVLRGSEWGVSMRSLTVSAAVATLT